MADTDTLPTLTDEQKKELGLIPSVDARSYAAPRPSGIPSVGQAPQIDAPAPTAGPVTTPSAIPSLAPPTKQQSQAAGKAEYAAGLPTVTAAPLTPEYYQQQRALSDFKAAHPLGSDVSARPGFLGKLEHGLATAGNIAGNALIPNVMAGIPGTQLNNEIQRGEQAKGFTAAVGNEQKAAEAKNQGAQAAKAQADIPFEAAQTASLNAELPLKPALTQSEINEHNAQAAALLHPQAKTDFEAWQQQNPGQPIENWLKAQTANKPPTAEQDTARATQLRADKAAGKTLSPDDANWLKGHTEEKLTAPAFTVQNATLTPLVNPTTGELVGSYNTKTGAETPAKQQLPGGATTAAGAGIGNKQIEAFNKDYINPAEAIERSYQMFQEAYKTIQNGDAKTGAEDMLLLSQHLGTTFGQVKGSRMNKDLIEEHKDAIGVQDRIERYANNLASGAALSPDQRKEFGDLIANMRNLTWQTATKEAARNNQPINFLPADVKVNMRDSKGDSRLVPGDRVQEYLNKGASLGSP